MAKAKSDTDVEITAPHVEVALSACVADLAEAGIAKSGFNTFHKFHFRGIDDVYGALSPVLAKNKLNCKPVMLERIVDKIQSGNGDYVKTSYWVSVRMKYTFCSAVDGSETSVEMWGEAMDTADKGTNKAASAAYKYMAFQTFCIPVKGDDDPDNEAPDPTVSGSKGGQGKPAGQAKPGGQTKQQSKPAAQSQAKAPMSLEELADVAVQVDNAKTDAEIRLVGAKVYEARSRVPSERLAELSQAILAARGKVVAAAAMDNFCSMAKGFVAAGMLTEQSAQIIVRDAKSRLNLPLE